MDRGRALQQAPRAGTKQALLVSMLKRHGGASVRELVEEMGWKANTVHAALSTVRTSGWRIAVEQAAGERRYRITAE
jgi:DNA-binding IclR family transcriptional regulator